MSHAQKAVGFALLLVVGSIILSAVMDHYTWYRFWVNVEELIAHLTGGAPAIGTIIVFVLLVREFIQPGPANSGWQTLVLPVVGVVVGLLLFRFAPQLMETVPRITRDDAVEVVTRIAGHLLKLAGTALVLLGGYRAGRLVVRRLLTDRE